MQRADFGTLVGAILKDSFSRKLAVSRTSSPRAAHRVTHAWLSSCGGRGGFSTLRAFRRALEISLRAALALSRLFPRTPPRVRSLAGRSFFCIVVLIVVVVVTVVVAGLSVVVFVVAVVVFAAVVVVLVVVVVFVVVVVVVFVVVAVVVVVGVVAVVAAAVVVLVLVLILGTKIRSLQICTPPTRNQYFS